MTSKETACRCVITPGDEVVVTGELAGTLRIDLSIAMLPASLWGEAGALPSDVMPGVHARP